MTYNIDIIKLFINNIINGISFKNISKTLSIKILTLKKDCIFLYSNNIINKNLIHKSLIQLN